MSGKIFAKFGSAVLTAAIAVNSLAVTNVFSNAASDVYEFEDGTITGTSTTVMTEESGYSGDGYVYMKDAGDTLSVEVEVPSAGMYDVTICYNIPTASGSKKQFMYINGVNQGEISFSPNDAFTETNIGTFKFAAGTNVIKIESSWGWTMFDYIKVAPATLPELSCSSELSDKSATKETKSLMNYLASVFGNNIISGQQEYYGTSREDEFDYIYNLSGKYPAIKGFDFGDTCPLYAWDDGATNRIINWVNDKGGIATASWHVNVPTKMDDYTLGSSLSWDKTTYTQNTDFVTANVLKEGTVEHDYFLLAVDNLAKELLKLQDANVPLIFRPFHEAEGNGGENGEGAWFWWSKEGAEVYKDLYKYLYQLLTEEYGLHNLIWEFNSYTYSTSYAWYPGTEYVDIIGYDKYNAKNWNTGAVAPNESAISGIFYSLFNMYGNDGKMIAMAENDTIPNLDNLITEKAGWLYFCPWYGEHLMDTNYNNPETLTEIYKSDYVITLDELPKDLYTNSSSPDKPTNPTTTSQTEPSTSESKVIYGDANCDESVDISDAVLIKCYLINSKKYALSEQGLKNADVHAAGNGVNAQDAVAVQKYVIKSIDALPIA